MTDKKDLEIVELKKRIVELEAQIKEFTDSDAKAIQYVGIKQFWSDHLYHSGLNFKKGDIALVPRELADKFLFHSDMFIEVAKESGMEVERVANKQAKASEAAIEAHKEEAEEQNDIIQEIMTMTKNGMIEYAERVYQIELDKKLSKGDIQGKVINLVERFGV